METKHLCQSCGMPLGNPDFAGTEKDGSKSKEYCTHCYQNGAFVKPGMTLMEMEKIVKEQMQKRAIDPALINLAVNTLPNLKRWGAKLARM
jgi:hypothetical protein